MTANYVRFRREKDGAEEAGIMINEDQLIIDASGTIVKDVWHYTNLPWRGCLIIDTENDQVFTQVKD